MDLTVCKGSDGGVQRVGRSKALVCVPCSRISSLSNEFKRLYGFKPGSRLILSLGPTKILPWVRLLSDIFVSGFWLKGVW